MSNGMMVFQNEAALTEAIREVVATTFDLHPTNVAETLSAAELPSWDSLHHFTLIVALEEQFGVTYTSDEIPQMTSVLTIVQATSDHLGLNG